LCTILEKKESRKYPVEFEGPRKDTDRMEIALPEGYQVDELPPPTDVEYSFGSYHKMEDLSKFCRVIGSDERGTAVLKQTGH